MWPSEYRADLLTHYRGPVNKSIVKRKPRKTGAPKYTNFDIDRIRRQKPLGQGEFGATYEYGVDSVVKVIQVMNKQHEIDTFREVDLHREAQTLVLPKDGFCCVPPIGFGPVVHISGGNKYVSYQMPKLSKMMHSEACFVRIIECCSFMVRNGFLHNDLHQGNVMMYNDKAVIIDLGLTVRYKPPAAEDLLQCIIFAQAAALIDNCNDNTHCPIDSIVKHLKQRKDMIVAKFDLVKNRRATLSNIMKKVDGVPDIDSIVRCQLLLACLSTKFRGCDFVDELCAEGALVGDFIYAIRNPRLFDTTYEEILEKARRDTPLLR